MIDMRWDDVGGYVRDWIEILENGYQGVDDRTVRIRVCCIELACFSRPSLVFCP